jgi:chromosome segregation ATPase
MYILSFNVMIIEIIALFIGAVILGGAIYFFQSSRRSLKTVLDKQDGPTILYDFNDIKMPNKPAPPPVDHLQQFRKKMEATEDAAPVTPPRQERSVKKEMPQESLQSLKKVIAEQQQLLTTLLVRAEESEHNKLANENNELQERIADLEAKLEEKDQEMGTMSQQVSAAQKMAERIEEVYREFEALQARLRDLESQASRAQKLEMELVDQMESYEQLKKDLVRKQARLEDTFAENQRLQQQLSEVEDKLAEANLQRQQLHKKVQFLQDLNNDLQQMSESNKRLQTELRRIGELESMLNMIAEERDILLRRQSK